MKRGTLNILICLLAGLPALVHGQAPAAFSSNETGVAANDTALVEIFLSIDGVTAYDTFGNSWVYDFRSDAFVLSDKPRSPRDRTSPEDVIEPVEERCTVEKRVSNYDADWQEAVDVKYDEYVNGDIRAWGDVNVRGWVIGDVRSTAGVVTVYESGRVDGDVKAPKIIVRGSGIIGGRQIQTERLDLPVGLLTDSFRTEGIWIVFGFTLFFLLAGFLVTSLAPSKLQRVEECIACCPGRSIGVGLLFIFLSPVVFALVAVTIVGIILLPLVPIAYLVSLCLGMIYCGRRLDRLLTRRWFRGERSVQFQGLFGVLLFMLLWTAVAILLGSSNSVANGFGIFILVVSIIVTSLVFMLGTGAVVLTRFGFRDFVPAVTEAGQSAEAAPAPAPPPLRNPPPVDVPQTPSSDAGPLPRPDLPHPPHSDDSSDPDKR